MLHHRALLRRSTRRAQRRWCRRCAKQSRLRDCNRDHRPGTRARLIPAQDEHYYFIVPKTRLGRAAVQRFRAVLEDPVTQDALIELGFNI
jgi:hypothetical protein